jgi:hypothetical protein
MNAAAVERRLTMRILQIWKGLAHPPDLPRRSQIDPRLFGADWGNCLLIDVDPKPEQSRIAFVGDRLRDTAWPPFDRQCLSECVSGTLLHLATSKLPLVLENMAPVSFGGPAVHGETPILYRAILLPLAEQGSVIDGILGAVNYRELPLSEGLGAMPGQVAAGSRGTPSALMRGDT